MKTNNGLKNEHLSFHELVEKKLLPLIKEHPTWIRLDGQVSSGNREIFGYFKWNDKVWKIHSDTHIDRMMLAYKLYQENGYYPFIEKPTSGNTCIDLNLDLKPKWFYVYLYRTDAEARK